MLSLMHALYSVKRAERLGPEQITVLREKRFRRLVQHVWLKSRFYRKYYSEHGIRERDLDKISPEDIPPINKNLVRANYSEIVSHPSLKHDVLERFITDRSLIGKKFENDKTILHTSGSSGVVGLFAYGPHDWNVVKARAFRIAQTRVDLLRKSRSAFIGATDGHYGGISLSRELPGWLYEFLPLSTSDPLEKICESIDRFKPHSLSGYSSGVYLLAQEQTKGNIDIKPRRISCGADKLTPSMRQTIQSAFRVNPIEVYSCCEAMCLAGDCTRHHRIHLFNDWYQLELGDGSGKPTPPGELGRVIVTNLYNYTQPLIRYEMSDEIVLSDKPCECNWPFPVISKIAGRLEEFLWFSNGKGEQEFLHPLVMVDFIVPGLTQFQLIQTHRNSLLMKVVIHGERDQVIGAIYKRMDEILMRKDLHQTVELQVEVVDSIANDAKTGKYGLIIPFSRKE